LNLTRLATDDFVLHTNSFRDQSLVCLQQMYKDSDKARELKMAQIAIENGTNCN
jgi:hypothetical protein